MSSSEINVPDDVKELVNKIVARNNLDSTSNVTYNVGSELGEGFMSKTVAVDIVSQKEALNLFVKYAINAKYMETMGLHKVYDNEIHFYDVIAPTYAKFLKEKGMENSFRNIPRCYGTSKGIVALENLRMRGYELSDKELIANEEHITLVLKTYAKFHAISFAYKDQNAEEYQQLLSGVTDVYRLDVSEEKAAQQLESARSTINNFLKQLDPVKDKYILDASARIVDKVIEFTSSMKNIVYENSILIQGDSWCNNMMFKYQDDKSVPLDVILIDWQIMRPASPIIDLTYFFYTAATASKESLNKLNYFLKIYHEELSIQMRKMGSDPEKVYSFSIFDAEWKKFCIFGYFMAYMILKAMLSSTDEAPDFEQTDLGKVSADEVFPTLKRNDELIDRLRNLTEHFLLKEFF